MTSKTDACLPVMIATTAFFSLLESDMYYRAPQMCTSNGFENSKRPLLPLGEGGNRPQSKTKYVRQKMEVFFPNHFLVDSGREEDREFFFLSTDP